MALACPEEGYICFGSCVPMMGCSHAIRLSQSMHCWYQSCCDKHLEAPMLMKVQLGK